MEAIDLVFVMDVSLSMAPFFQKLEQEIFVVDEALRALGLSKPPHYGLVVFVDDTLTTQGGAPYLDAVSLRDAFVQWRGFTSLNSQVNDPAALNLSWTENSLDGLYGASTEFAWRPAETTLRMIIHTTDDTFWDLAVSATGEPLGAFGAASSLHGYPETIDAIRAGAIRVNHFAAHTRASDGLDVSAGFFTPYAGMQTIPLSTGGVAWDINLVLNGTVSLAEDIRTAVIDTQCEVYPEEIPPVIE